MHKQRSHVLIVGGGISGLIAAVKLQQTNNTRVTIVEKSSRLGGLCGTHTINGHDYVIACNDFGLGMQSIFNSIGVDQKFESLKSRVYYEGKFYDSQIGVHTFFQLLPDWKNCFRLLYGIIKNVFSTSSCSLEEFVDSHTSPGLVNDYAKLVSYFMGVKASELSTSFFTLDGKYKYGYKKMICPVGGPQSMIDGLVSKFLKQGGEVFINTEILAIRDGDDGVSVTVKDDTSVEPYTYSDFDKVINTSGARDLYPKDVKRGMKLSSMCICLSNDFCYPDGFHTFSYYPKNVSRWFAELDKGETPREFGFHVFNSRLSKYYLDGNLEGDAYTVNVFFYAPRGYDSLTLTKKEFYTTYILDRLDHMLPGIKAAIRSHTIIDPDEFSAMHGYSSAVMPFISSQDMPQNRQGKDIYYAGHHVYPPGGHAGASALSAINVAQQIH